MLLSWIFLATFLVIYTKSDNGLAGLNSTIVAKENVDLKPKTLVLNNEKKSEQNTLISYLGSKELSRNTGRIIRMFYLQLLLPFH